MNLDALRQEWRPVDGWPYEVSDQGYVRRSFDGPPRNGATPGLVLRPFLDAAGYQNVVLYDKKRRRNARLHKLVAEAFLPPPEEGKTEVAHGDGNPTNNRPTNLRWATRAENCADTIMHGHSQRGAKNYFSKVSEKDVATIRRLATGKPTKEAKKIGAHFGISRQQVQRIAKGHSWRWLGKADEHP